MAIKRTRLETFAVSVVDNLCLLQQNKWNTIKIRAIAAINHRRAIRITFRDHSPVFSSVAEKTGRNLEIFLAVGYAL